MRYSILFASCFWAFFSSAQIVDDTTELVYGPETTKIILEQDVKDGMEIARHPDTTLYGLENYTQLDRLHHYYQDLGNNGTALFPVFYPMNENIGLSSGFNSFDPYYYTPDRIRYYDTKSPFMDVYVVFGGQNRSVVDFSYTRNINANWNMGFDVYKFTSDKQIGYSGRGDRNAEGTTVDFHTYYRHKTLPYTLLFSAAGMTLNVEETGGILLDSLPTATNAELFEYQDSPIRLIDARNRDKRSAVHVYHQYKIKPELQVYHQFDLYSQVNGFSDFGDDAQDPGYYPEFLFDRDSSYERATFRTHTHEAGIKGDLASLFYRFYVKTREVTASYLYFDPLPETLRENYLGGYTRFTWKEKFNIEGNGELLQSGEYKIIGKLNSDLIFGSYSSYRSKPSLFSTAYFGNQGEWYSDFSSVFMNEIKGGLHLDLRFLEVTPTLRLVSMNNFIYFDEEIMPTQGKAAFLASVGGKINLSIATKKELGEGFHIQNEFYLSDVSGPDAEAIRVPVLFYNGKIYWEGRWFNEYMPIQIGFDLHAKSGYYAMDYFPSYQQFYLQNEFFIEPFWTADFFANVQVNNFRAFFKITNVNQTAESGYFITPYYPGESFRLDFGARWQFYD